MIARWLLALAVALALAGCGGDSSTPMAAPTVTPVAVAPTPTPAPVPAPTPAATANSAAVVFDNGPPGVNAFNEPYVTITLCAPGSTTNCQTIDHIILDTGSIGLRIIQPVLNASLLAALPTEKDAASNPVGECYQYVNSFVFGSVRTADFSIAGEKVASMPFHAIADTGTFATVPSGCSSGAGTPVQTVADFGGNGILGIGTTTTDCGSYCTVTGGTSGASYYDCPASGCGAIVGRAANASPPFEQLPNPVAAMPVDNNGTIMTLPSVPQRGLTSLTGTVVFGINTQADNALTAGTILPLRTSSGTLTATYNGKRLSQSFFDSGSSEYFFIDASLTACTDPNLIALYCPTSPLLLSPTVTATNGVTVSEAFTLYSPLFVPGSSVVAPGLGINPTLVKPPLPFANSFDFGIPFYFGKSVYTAIEGRQAGTVVGPYVAY